MPLRTLKCNLQWRKLEYFPSRVLSENERNLEERAKESATEQNMKAAHMHSDLFRNRLRHIREDRSTVLRSHHTLCTPHCSDRGCCRGVYTPPEIPRNQELRQPNPQEPG